jgi:hypothetical protein
MKAEEARETVEWKRHYKGDGRAGETRGTWERRGDAHGRAWKKKIIEK